MANATWDGDVAVLNGNDAMAVANWLQAHGLIHNVRICPNCGNAMTLRRKAAYRLDKVCWSCGAPCHTDRCITYGTFLEQLPKLCVFKILQLIREWTFKITAKECEARSGVGYKSLLKVYKFLRQRCAAKLLRNPIQIGGSPFVVKLTRACFNMLK